MTADKAGSILNSKLCCPWQTVAGASHLQSAHEADDVHHIEEGLIDSSPRVDIGDDDPHVADISKRMCPSTHDEEEASP